MKARLQILVDRYPGTEAFWVDSDRLTWSIGEHPVDIPERWTYSDVIAFASQTGQKDQLTFTALLSGDVRNGFMTIRFPRALTSIADIPPYRNAALISLMIAVYALLLLVSFLFFYRIRIRLVRLEAAMTVKGESGIPSGIIPGKNDEIGRLELAFNTMSSQLKSMRESEKQEEELRKQLVANLSHDLRTPLTVIRQHVHTLLKRPSDPSHGSLRIINRKLDDIGKLMDNLLSYTLLSAGKYPMEIKDTDILEELRNAAADWYPVFEEEGLEVEIDLPEQPVTWRIDPFWFRVIVDNLFQNVIRHAKTGRYIGIFCCEQEGEMVVAIRDHGPGIAYRSGAKGAEIGLSIVSLMIKDMNLQWKIDSENIGTTVYIRT
ncbi:sensor histidine kinase [Paenibacillus harenae]|uniref:sensor histidine kinase n=1 Tax=Paenibacillus harenae TaxID=306543 RepID=UPI00146F5FE2|nr:HAMP domain-containing sensor histidine kinase [Paenibacillus harenae]